MSHDTPIEIFEAIRQGQVDRLPQAVRSAADANRRDSWGQHPLVLAAALGQIDCVEWLLDHGAEIDASSRSANSFGEQQGGSGEPQSPLHDASSTEEETAPPRSQSQRILYLLEGGPNGEDLNDSYETALGDLSQMELPLSNMGASLSQDPLRSETENETALAAACRNGHESVVALLLSRGASTQPRHWNQTPALVCAVERGCPAIVRQLLVAGAFPDSILDISPLTAAAMEGKTAIMKQLLEAGANPNLTDEEGYTPLMAAAASGSMDATECLVEAGAEVSADVNGITAAMCAADEGHTDICQFLEERAEQGGSGTDGLGREPSYPAPIPISSASASRPLSRSDQLLRSDFLDAAMVGDLAGVQECFTQGAPIDSIGSEGYSALMYAAANGHEQVVDWLIKHGASLELRATHGSADAQVAWIGILGRDNGATALGLVAGSCFCPNRPAMLAQLVWAGADPNACDTSGMTPLLRAVSHTMVDSCEALLELGADVHACDHEGNTAVMLAHLCKNDTMLELLHDAGATTDGLQNVLLCDAVETCNVGQVRELIQRGADVNHRGDTTPLVLAVGTRSVELVDILLEAGADPNRAAEPGGFTPIARAAYAGDSTLVHRLLEAGADPLIPVLTAYDAVQYARLGAAEGRGDADCYLEIRNLFERKVG